MQMSFGWTASSSLRGVLPHPPTTTLSKRFQKRSFVLSRRRRLFCRPSETEHRETKNLRPLPEGDPVPENETEPEVPPIEPRPRPPNFFLWLMGQTLRFCLILTRTVQWFFGNAASRWILLTITIFGANFLVSSHKKYTVNVLYSEFVKQVEAGKVETVYFEAKTNNLRFNYRTEMWERLRQQLRDKKITSTEIERRIRRIQTVSKAIPGQTDRLTQLLKRKRVNYGVADQSFNSFLSSFISTMFWLWVPLLPLLIILARSLDTQLGRKNQKVKKSSTTHVRFRDVAGMESAKIELIEVVELLKHPSKYAKLNAKAPSGVLLCGPTGTGKTLLARAIAGEAGVPFFAVSASEFVEMFVGRGAARIRELFREARKHTPCVVFIDEIDSVGGLRGTSFNEERDQTLNQLLVELDGFEDNKSIVLLAATNRFKSLDPALLRPGRLTRKISIPLPDEPARAAILAVHLRDVPMATVQDKVAACEFIARLSDGFSGAELANTVNEAALMAAREDRSTIEIDDLIKGLQRTRYPVNNTSPLPLWLRSFQTSLLKQTWQQIKSLPQLPS